MQAISLNRITQGSHGTSKAVDISANPDPTIYAPEDGVIESYQQRGSGKSDAGLALRMNGSNGLHQFAHTERSLVKVGERVKRGQPIAIMGHTGYTIPSGPAGAHCHWWILKNGRYTYPPSLINQSFIKLTEGKDMINNRSEAQLLYNSLLHRNAGTNAELDGRIGQTWEFALADMKKSAEWKKTDSYTKNYPKVEQENTALKAQVKALEKQLAEAGDSGKFKKVEVYVKEGA